MDVQTSEQEQDRRWGYLLLRVMLGVNIFMHGASRVLSGTGQFAGTLVHEFQSTVLPSALVHGFAVVLPWVEAATGLLVLVGLFRRPALLVGGATLVALTFGSTLRQDWQSASLQLTYAIVYAALLAFLQYDRYTLDALLFERRTPAFEDAQGAELP